MTLERFTSGTIELLLSSHLALEQCAVLRSLETSELGGCGGYQLFTSFLVDFETQADKIPEICLRPQVIHFNNELRP